MLLLLIAVPVIILVATSQRLLQAYAPPNVLIRRVRSTRPTIRTAVALGILAFVCAAAAHAVTSAIEAGGPGWLSIIVLVLTWDAIRIGVLALLVSVRLLPYLPGVAPRLPLHSGPVR